MFFGAGNIGGIVRLFFRLFSYFIGLLILIVIYDVYFSVSIFIGC